MQLFFHEALYFPLGKEEKKKKKKASNLWKPPVLCSNVILISHPLWSAEQVLADIEDGCGENRG